MNKQILIEQTDLCYDVINMILDYNTHSRYHYKKQFSSVIDEFKQLVDLTNKGCKVYKTFAPSFLTRKIIDDNLKCCQLLIKLIYNNRKHGTFYKTKIVDFFGLFNSDSENDDEDINIA